MLVGLKVEIKELTCTCGNPLGQHGQPSSVHSEEHRELARISYTRKPKFRGRRADWWQSVRKWQVHPSRAPCKSSRCQGHARCQGWGRGLAANSWKPCSGSRIRISSLFRSATHTWWTWRLQRAPRAANLPVAPWTGQRRCRALRSIRRKQGTVGRLECYVATQLWWLRSSGMSWLALLWSPQALHHATSTCTHSVTTVRSEVFGPG